MGSWDPGYFRCSWSPCFGLSVALWDLGGLLSCSHCEMRYKDNMTDYTQVRVINSTLHPSPPPDIIRGRVRVVMCGVPFRRQRGR